MNPSGLLSPQLRFLLSKPFSLASNKKTKIGVKAGKGGGEEGRGALSVGSQGRGRADSILLTVHPNGKRMGGGDTPREQEVQQPAKGQGRSTPHETLLLVPGLQKGSGSFSPFIAKESKRSP